MTHCARTIRRRRHLLGCAAVLFCTSTLGAQDPGGEPPATLLHQNFPNPFPRPDLGRVDTHVWFDLPQRGSVQLTIHDVRGVLVRRLIPAPGCGPVELDPGFYGRSDSGDPCVLVRWDGRDDRGRAVESGVYLLRLRALGTEQIRHVVFWP